jgi:hypothetical protein
MPEKRTIQRAKKDLRAGKSASTAAGEFVRQEMEHIREGKHGAKNAKQAIAIGLSEARRAGIPVKGKGKSAERPQRKATRKTSAKRSRAAKSALKKQPRSAASHRALSRQAHSAAKSRTKADRSRAAKKAARTRSRNKAGGSRASR